MFYEDYLEYEYCILQSFILKSLNNNPWGHFWLGDFVNLSSYFIHIGIMFEVKNVWEGRVEQPWLKPTSPTTEKGCKSLEMNIPTVTVIVFVFIWVRRIWLFGWIWLLFFDHVCSSAAWWCCCHWMISKCWKCFHLCSLYRGYGTYNTVLNFSLPFFSQEEHLKPRI